MMEKPTTAAGYPPELAQEARRMCLYVATILGDLLDDIVVVGGLVPYLIVDQNEDQRETHVGTRDLDLGLSLAVLDEERYREISSRLRARGFQQATNEDGNPTKQTWRLPAERVTIDFLIPPTKAGQRPGSLQRLERDFAAIVMPALPVAFVDAIDVSIDGTTPTGERATRTVRVCGPAAFVVMKAYALHFRGENKDAYDLVYMLLNYGPEPVTAVVERFDLIRGDAHAQEALEFLEAEFKTAQHVGPMRRAEFLGDRANLGLRQDAVGVVQDLVRRVRAAAEMPGGGGRR